MKGQNPIILAKNPLVIIIGIVIFIGIMVSAGNFLAPGSIFGSFLKPAELYGGCDVKESATFALIPYYGYYSCEPVSYTPTSTSVSNWAPKQGDWGNYYATLTISCPQVNSLTKQCDIVVRDKGYFFGTGAYFNYRVCFNGSCGAYQFTQLISSQTTTIATITSGKSIDIKYNTGFDGSATVPLNSIEVLENHIGYGLWQYERGTKNLLDSTGCSVPLSAAQCIDCKTSNIGVDSGISTITNNPVSILLPDTFSTYLKDWLVSPVKSGLILDTDGSSVFCSANTLYNVGTTKTELGCGAFPISVKRPVTCCPGDKLNQYTSCSNDFKWVQADYGCIKGGIPSISSCNGQGNWYSTGSLSYQKATSCNTDGTCSYQTVTASCTAPNIGCATGSTCVVDNNNPANNKCQGGITACGDNNKDCFDDCTYTAIPNCKTTNPCAGKNEPTGGMFIGKKDCCQGLTEQNGICKEGIDYLTLIIGIITTFIYSFIVSTVLLFILKIAMTIPTPIMMALKPLSFIKPYLLNYKSLLIISLVIAVLITLLFSVSVNTFAASIMGS